jgi:alpha-mannosidase
MNQIDGAVTTRRRSQAELRRSLGVPDSATYVLVLDQSAHCDWDWRRMFRDYLELPAPLNGSFGVAQILDAAIDNLTDPSDPGYRYSFCELGYLQAYLQLPGKFGQLARLAAAGGRFRIVGGGITSPDCLLSAGETFIRNYLVGKLWLAQHLPGQLPLRHCWIPDDFGQDPELPVSLAAMGMTGVSFSRLPGLGPDGCPEDPTYYENDLIAHGADFTWQASDGASEVLTHWMPGAVPGYYTPGGDLRSAEQCGGTTPEDVLTAFLASNNATAATQPPYSAAPTNYVYLPIDADFMHPLLHLSAEIAQFNADAGAELGVYAVAASFADFVDLALAADSTLAVRRYNGTPVWTGIYASRPALKTLHYQGTRSMLAAEALGLLAYGHDPDTDAARAHWADAAAAWGQLLPSTHHDYITGTASDATDNKQPQAQNVVYEEQLPLLAQAVGQATSLVDTALAALATHADADEWVVVNPSGVRYSGPIELTGQLPEDVRSLRIGDGLHSVQRTEIGGSSPPTFRVWRA